MPEQLSKIKKVEDLKRVTGIEDVAYFSGHPSSFPYLEECLSPLKEKRKELVCAKIELDKGVKSFVSLLPLVHKDAQYFYFEEALLSYLKGLDLQEFTAEYTILQKSVSGNLQSMAYRYISNFLSKRSFDELLTLSKLGTYDKEVAEMITEYKRRRIKEATLSDDWFIQRIKDRRFDGFKPRFRKQAAFLLQGEDVS